MFDRTSGRDGQTAIGEEPSIQTRSDQSFREVANSSSPQPFLAQLESCSGSGELAISIPSPSHKGVAIVRREGVRQEECQNEAGALANEGAFDLKIISI